MPFFLIHQPVIIIAFFVVQWEASIMAKLPLVVLGSLVVALGLVELIIKRFDVLRRLFGARPGIRVQQVQERFQALTGSKLAKAYGLSETSPATHVNPLARHQRPYRRPRHW